jgi:hypothetical protein
MHYNSVPHGLSAKIIQYMDSQIFGFSILLPLTVLNLVNQKMVVNCKGYFFLVDFFLFTSPIFFFFVLEKDNRDYQKIVTQHTHPSHSQTFLSNSWFMHPFPLGRGRLPESIVVLAWCGSGGFHTSFHTRSSNDAFWVQNSNFSNVTWFEKKKFPGLPGREIPTFTGERLQPWPVSEDFITDSPT